MPKTRKRIKVLICNRYALFRDGLKAIFRNHLRIQIAGDTGTGEDAVAAAHKLRPDVLLLDVDLPDISGFATMQKILANDPEVKVLLLTLSRNHRGQITRCLESGAAGQIRRKDRPQELEKAILAAAAEKPAAAGGRRTAAGGRKA